MSDDSMLSGVKSIFLNGINLNLESPEEEQHYMIHLADYFEEETDFTAYLSKDNTLEVETEGMQLGMQIHIIDSILFMIPHVSEVFEIFTEVLRFISTHHQTVIRKFRGIEETKIESLKELNGLKDVKEKNPEEEPSSEDDYEWI
tara:strand:- start:1668 stop:2102 length:435 start_codon:yes stop_codon:yes gene_type:complete